MFSISLFILFVLLLLSTGREGKGGLGKRRICHTFEEENKGKKIDKNNTGLQKGMKRLKEKQREKKTHCRVKQGNK